jgi:alpha-L-fucosidase
VARRSVGSGEDDAPLDLRNDTGYWRPHAADPAPTLRLTWDSPRLISAVVLKEQITLGQRIERVELSARTAGGAVELGAANSVGYQRFIELEPVEATELVLRFPRCRGTLHLAGVGVIARGVRA